MKKVEETVDIKASPGEVFEVIQRITDFPRYTPFLKEVKEVGNDSFQWIARIGSIELTWDSTITEFVKDERIVWASTRGIKNSGSFELEPTNEGTKVTFCMEYQLPLTSIENVVSFVSSHWMKKITADILKNVKENLEK